MTSGFRIEIERLGTMTTALQHAKEEMTKASMQLKDSSPSDLGSHDIDKAGAEFQDRWEHGIDKIAKFSGDVVESLTEARKLYIEMEAKAVEILGGNASQLPPFAGTETPWSAGADAPRLRDSAGKSGIGQSLDGGA